MPRLNLTDIVVKPVVNETRTLVDPEQPDFPWTLTLRPSKDAPAQFAIYERGTQYVDEYIKGKKDPDTGKRGPIVPFPTVNGERVAITETFLRQVATLEVMQVPTEECPALSFSELLAASVYYPAAFIEAFQWANALNAIAFTGDAVEDAATNP